jgi:hypothetical protein
VNSPPPKPEVILTNFFAEPTVLLVPITSRVVATFENHTVPSQTDLTRTGIVSNSYNEMFEA